MWRRKAVTGWYQSTAGIREFLHNGRGIYPLSGKIETNNNITRFIRSGDRLTEIVDPVGRKTTLAYNPDGLIETITDPQGNVHRYSYDGDKLTEMVRTCTKTCIGSGGTGDETDPGGDGGLTPEQIQAIAAVIQALLDAQSAANGAGEIRGRP